ncbi:BURP domain-containing protein [Quillaja saponaria]|uniref:BURP domain-containing protein n=1 Tax=Quillaja saponaria TaxID=32244 RepID=A0AAD7M009_QUISA|nr:BURP domain-containing protein [Quillaja saponaria]
MNPAVKVFFNLIDLKVGKTIPIYLHKKDPSTSPKLLSREEADQIPFSLKQLKSLLRFFSFTKHSPQAKAIKYTLKLCELKPIKEETKSCATSLESMLDFAHFTFGPDTQFKVLTTTNLTKSTVLSQNYTILEVKEISAPKMVACHIMPYPYAIFYGHSQETQNKLFEVSIGGENGEGIQTAAVCHMDTSYWDRKHVAFHVLRVEVGSPVCHFSCAINRLSLPATICTCRF